MDIPSLTCPGCGGQLEYQATLELLDPPVGKIDTGFCAVCGHLLERVRQTGTYQPTLWLPLCRICRQPVAFARLDPGPPDEVVVFECRDHPHERWRWLRGTDRWTRETTF
jgi:hypothetical protein